MSDELSIPSPTYRVPRRGPSWEPGTKRLALIAGGIGGLLVLVVGGWTLIGHRSGSVPVVQADTRPIRVKPENPGGMQVAGANNEILSGGTESKAGKLAPPPEAPAPQALRAPPPAPAPAITTPAAPAVTPGSAITQSPLLPATKPAVPPAKPQATAANDKPIAEKPAAAPVAPPSIAAAPAVAKNGGARVQLAAVSSEEAAKNEWQRLEKRMPDLFGRRQPAFTKTERDGRTLWRVRTGGFNDVAQATAFCERVRAKGAGCAVAEF